MDGPDDDLTTVEMRQRNHEGAGVWNSRAASRMGVVGRPGTMSSTLPQSSNRNAVLVVQSDGDRRALSDGVTSGESRSPQDRARADADSDYIDEFEDFSSGDEAIYENMVSDDLTTVVYTYGSPFIAGRCTQYWWPRPRGNLSR